jgi:hypothetical protein
MTATELVRRLGRQRIVKLSAEEWERVADHFVVLETHDTRLAGKLLLVRDGRGLAAVEQPAPGRRVIRRLDGESEARAFIQERLDTYDRMWDGCGCKIDYFD